ncbi:Low copy number virion structural protein [Viridibacillus sp. NPDC096237]|uniref:Low copy number virion structural protein n=1 Tax=Viridibacillus sp. NPDC096237 TaxID=3390721 RepID=UPI003D089E9D
MAKQGFITTYTAGGRFDAPFFPTLTEPFIKGVRVVIGGSDSFVTNTYTIARKSELISIAIACTEYYDEDNWDLVVNNKTMIESVYTKELPEGLFFMVAHPLNVGDTIEIRFKNESGKKKNIWINYQFLTK